jgi:hypothetical protein
MGQRPLVAHTACIDLPGEPVSCWTDTETTVLLRKHRDVLFDIKLKAGATYTVDTPQDWFYDVAKKKRVQHGQFTDGQRYHIWVGRSFKGRLTIKQNGKELQHFTMQTLGLTDSNSDPKYKPAPIIIALGHRPDTPPSGAASPAASKPASAAAAGHAGAPVNAMAHAPATGTAPPAAAAVAARPAPGTPVTHAAPVQPPSASPLPVKLKPGTKLTPTQDAHVVQVDHESIPSIVLDALASGGGDETAIDTNNIATRNWLIGQLAGATAYLNDNKEWIGELWGERFRLVKVIHKTVGERMYVVFTGNQKTRELITASKYGVKNAKVLTIGGGAGNFESATSAVWENSKGAFKESGLIALIFTIGLDTAEWLHDYEQIGPDGKRKKDFADLLGKIGMDLVKAGLSAAIATVVVGAIVAGIAGTVALPVAAIVVGTMIVAVAVGYGLDYLDKQTHATEHVSSWLRSIGEALKSGAEYLANAMPKDYDGYSMMYMGP